MILLVCGGRDFTDVEYAIPRIHNIHLKTPVTKLICGMAKGGDSIAYAWAKAMGIPIAEYPVTPEDWKKFGKAAGSLRNQKMLDKEHPDLVVGLPGGNGTAHMLKIARKAGKHVIEYKGDIMIETKRPTSKDEKVRRKAAETALPFIVDWLGSEYHEDQRDHTVDALVEAFGQTTDGYGVCRYLDKMHGWYPDTDLVDILDQQFLWDAEKEAVREWVKEAGVQPLFKCGDVITFEWHSSTSASGIIDDIYRESAKYSIKLDQKSFVVVPFEDARLLPSQEDSATAE